MMLYCYPKEVNVLSLSSLYGNMGFFLNATTITTWIDFYELGCIQGLFALV
jgi:hypothetical protein